MTASRDADGKQVIASVDLDTAALERLEGSRGVRLPLQGASRCFVTLNLAKGDLLKLSGGGMRAFLRHVGKSYPQVIAGTNRLDYDLPSGARAAVSLERPTAIDLGQEVSSASGCEVTRCQGDGPLGGGSYLRVTVAPGLENWFLKIKVPAGKTDFTGVGFLRITYRVNSWCGRVQVVGNSSADPLKTVSFTSVPLVPTTLEPEPWRERLIKLELRGKGGYGDIAQLLLFSWGPDWKRPAMVPPPQIDIAGIELIPASPAELAAEAEQQQARERWQEATAQSELAKALDATPLRQGDLIPPGEFFARGMWGVPAGGSLQDLRLPGCSDAWQARRLILQDLKAHHLNAVHYEVSHLSPEDNLRYVKLADAEGIRLWGCYTVFSRIPGSATPAVRSQIWSELSKPFEALVAQFKSCPTMVVWAIGEEPADWGLPLLRESREIMARHHAQPQIIIYNDPQRMRQDVATPPLPGGVAYDRYVLLTLGRNFDAYVATMRDGWEASKLCDGPFWVVPQLVGMESGHSRLYLSPTQAEMRFQVWTALAYNAKGFFPWMYWEGGKTKDFTDTSYFLYYSREMARLERIERLLVAMRRDDQLNLLENPDPKVLLLGCFADRRHPERQFVLTVNLDTDKPRSFVLKPTGESGHVIEIVAGEDSVSLRERWGGEEIMIEPGDGRLFHVGGLDREGLAEEYQDSSFPWLL